MRSQELFQFIFRVYLTYWKTLQLYSLGGKKCDSSSPRLAVIAGRKKGEQTDLSGGGAGKRRYISSGLFPSRDSPSLQAPEIWMRNTRGERRREGEEDPSLRGGVVKLAMKNVALSDQRYALTCSLRFPLGAWSACGSISFHLRRAFPHSHSICLKPSLMARQPRSPRGDESPAVRPGGPAHLSLRNATFRRRGLSAQAGERRGPFSLSHAGVCGRETQFSPSPPLSTTFLLHRPLLIRRRRRRRRRRGLRLRKRYLRAARRLEASGEATGAVATGKKS